MRRAYPLTIIVVGSLLALAAAQPGLDYFNDSSAIDALARGDLRGMFAEQPLMGPLSIFVRAPFVAAVFRADLTTVYLGGAVPCILSLVIVTGQLVGRMRAETRIRADQALVVLLSLGSITMVRAMHWGHPEDILATAGAIGGMLAADRQRPGLAGVLIGAAFASKQWAVLAGLPALLVLTRGRVRFLAAAAGTGVLFMAPMFIGDPDRFLLVQRAAGSVDPMYVLGNRPQAPGAHVNPYDVWLPFASPRPFEGRSLLFMDDTLARFAHPFVLLLGIVLPALVWRRSRTISLRTGLLLLALILLLRSALDPMSLEYYHLPAVVALAAAAAVGDARDMDVALLATAGLTLAFMRTAVGVDALEQAAWLKFAVYMAAVVPSVVWLSREVYGVPRLVKRASRSPRVHAASSSA